MILLGKVGIARTLLFKSKNLIIKYCFKLTKRNNTHEMEIKIMASAAVVNRNNEILILRRSVKEKFLAGYWTIVGGKYEDSDKSIEGAVFREVLEETGLDVNIIKPINVQEFTRDDKPGVRAVEITYLCSTDDDQVKLSPEEHDTFRWINNSQVAELDLITDLTKQKLTDIFKVIN